MSETPEHLAKRLLEEGEKTLAFFRALSPETWERQVYTEGACWAIHQVLAHFVSAEDALRRLVIHILEGGAGAPEDFDLNSYNERKVNELQEVPPDGLMERFAAQRQETADLVVRMQPADLARTGRHPFLGIATLEDIIKLIYRHNGIHLREIRGRIPN